MQCKTSRDHGVRHYWEDTSRSCAKKDLNISQNPQVGVHSCRTAMAEWSSSSCWLITKASPPPPPPLPPPPAAAASASRMRFSACASSETEVRTASRSRSESRHPNRQGDRNWRVIASAAWGTTEIYHGRMNYKDIEPYMSAFLKKIYLLTDFAAFCLTDFIDWRYIHSVVCIFDPACELLPPRRKELYLCTVAPLLYLLSDLLPLPPFPMYSICRQCVWLWGEGGWGDVELCCRPYSAGVLHSVSDQIQNLQNCYTIPNKKDQ